MKVAKAVAKACSILVVTWKTLNDALDKGIGFEAIYKMKVRPQDELEAVRETTGSSDTD
jgi:hypothetical protein